MAIVKFDRFLPFTSEIAAESSCFISGEATKLNLSQFRCDCCMLSEWGNSIRGVKVTSLLAKTA